MADTARRITRDELARLLASALGQEKADEVVTSAAHALGFAGSSHTIEEARAILERLATTEGLIGVVARFALSRGDVDALVESAPASEARPSASPERPSKSPRADVVDLLPLLAPALGTEKARDATTAVATRLGLDARCLTREEALTVLDELAREGGIVGVVARFAKARFLLGPSA